MEVNKKEIDEILLALEDSNFNDLCDDLFYDNIVRPFKERYKKSFKYDSGATKGVLIFEQFDFVVKIPFNFTCDMELFCGADDSGPGWNYCEVEEIKSERAEAYGIGECFAKTIRVGSVKNHPIYVQELARIFTTAGSPSPKPKSKEELEKIEDMCDGLSECFNNIWLSDALDYFGEKVFYGLLNFIDDYEISDLHDANIGYIGMRPVLVDYSSFND